MELEISLHVLQQAEEELNNCCRIAWNCTEEISEILVALDKCMPDEMEIWKYLKSEQQNMGADGEGLKQLYSGLKQIREMYGQYERELMLWQEKLR